MIADVMARLDEEDRENVIYVAEDGAIYSNKMELKEATEVYDLVENNVYQSASEKNLLVPECPRMIFQHLLLKMIPKFRPLPKYLIQAEVPVLIEEFSQIMDTTG